MSAFKRIQEEFLGGHLQGHTRPTTPQCSDQGSDFFEAFVDGELYDFGGFEQHDPRFELLSPTGIYKTSGDVTEVPLVTAQVTRFQCGGSSLVLGVHHNVGDEFSASSFLTAWSLVSRGEGEEFLAPCFDHSLMDAKTLRKVDDPAKLFNHVEYQTQRPNVPATFPELKACMFKFPTWAIETLRSFCGPGTIKFEALLTSGSPSPRLGISSRTKKPSWGWLWMDELDSPHLFQRNTLET
ncbi:hypothetical protein SELMODRAFT_414046 [Selaginella moellendorffii]|uniref:BAHD family acyltransferase, clade V n=1 Tax=Selaginella moellendorffii TaxID=88036 RepID=D8RRG3_SELML|nr:hypothetical protein SELMODRAFT_414046 [Selaginella moellendorffii]